MKNNPFVTPSYPDFKNVGSLSKEEASKEIKQLRDAIEFHNYRYYIKNDPVISDSKYDALFGRLLKLEEKFPDFQSDVSPTRKVGAPPLEKLEKREHVAKMFSLNSSDKKKDVRGFVNFIKKQIEEAEPKFSLEPKFDGLSIEVVYKEGLFDYATTRGDGQTGEDVSENIKTLRSLPLKLTAENEFPDFLSVRGEVYMSKDGFQRINKQRLENGQEPFANARNAAAGLIRQLDPGKVAGKPLDIFFYEIIGSSDNDFVSHNDMLKHFEEWGLKINHESRTSSDIGAISDFYDYLGKKRDELPYEIDGIVIKLDNRQYRERLGTRHRSPRWAFAWKFEPRREITTLREIIVQVGRTGILTPVALLDPVEVGGVTVSRATLHNKQEIKKKDVRPGDKVKVVRAGDVIPEITGLVEQPKKRGKPFEMPDHCPVCNAPVAEEGAYVICPAGLSCKAQLKGSLRHFSSRDAMNIDSLGEKRIDELVEKGMINNIPDLYHLKPEDFKELSGFAGKSSNKLYEAINASKKPGLSRFLYALGIRHAGNHIARVLALKYQSLDKIIDASYEELEDIEEIGPEIARSIVNFFDNRDNLQIIQQLREAGIKIKPDLSSKQGKLEGKNFVLTGELEEFTRNEATEKIESLGGRTTSSVSGNTDYLVVGKDPGSKLDEAKQRNVNILNEEKFKKMIN